MYHRAGLWLTNTTADLQLLFLEAPGGTFQPHTEQDYKKKAYFRLNGASGIWKGRKQMEEETEKYYREMEKLFLFKLLGQYSQVF